MCFWLLVHRNWTACGDDDDDMEGLKIGHLGTAKYVYSPLCGDAQNTRCGDLCSAYAYAMFWSSDLS